MKMIGENKIMKKQADGIANSKKKSSRINKKQKQQYVQMGAVLFTAIAVMAGVYLAVAWAKSSPGGSSTDSVASSEIQSSGSASPEVSSAPSSESSSDSVSVSASITTPTTAPTPTKAPSSSQAAGVSTARDGWWYSPGKTSGSPATTSTAHISLCDRYGGIWQADTTKKIVYITMDCGYDFNGNTEKILNIAKEKNFKITFFLTGAMFETPALKALVLRMVNEGHLVGNHTWNHPSLPILLNEKGAAAVNVEMDKVEAAFKELTGKEIARYMRPPMGEFSEASMQLMQKRGYKTVYWSFAHRDWITAEQPTEDAAKKTVSYGLHNGVVFLLHTVSNTNVAILPWLADQIRAQGYEFGLVNAIK